MADEQEVILDELLSACLHRETDRENVLEGFRHRLKLCRAWGIPAGSQILDIGCGQGESSLVLALRNGPDAGLVTGIDNGPPEYGAPITTGDARRFIEAAPLGRRIRFQRTEAPALLAGPPAGPPPPRFDVAVAMHSLWYFDSEVQVRALFAGLARARVGRLCLAEYTGVADAPAQRAHQRAAEAQIRLHAARRPPASDDDDEGDAVHKPNVRAALLPARLVALAAQAGWRVRRSGVVEASGALMDGHWEAQMVQADGFRDEVRAARLDPDVEADILRLADEVKDLVQELSLRGARAQCMHSFWAVLSLDDE